MLKQKKNNTQLRQGIPLVKNIKTHNHPILIKYLPINYTDPATGAST